MTVDDVLHLGAAGFTALAAGLHPGWRRWGSSLGLGAAILMLAAMVDVDYGDPSHFVVWTPLLLTAALVCAAARSGRRRAAVAQGGVGICVTTHVPLGLVATAALLPIMHMGTVHPSGHAEHGVASGALVAVVLAIAAGYVLGSIVAFARTSGTASRRQYLLMAAAMSLMAISAIA